jgi:hypothetical protein
MLDRLLHVLVGGHAGRRLLELVSEGKYNATSSATVETNMVYLVSEQQCFMADRLIATVIAGVETA